jgi:excinuclease ABC subunit B
MDLQSYIGKLEAKMKDAAANLEFEEAARLRDEIRRLEASELGVRTAPTARPAMRAELQRAKSQNSRARAQRMAKARRQRAPGGR